MQAPKHPDYNLETNKLKELCNKIDNEILLHVEQVNNYQEKIEDTRQKSGGGFDNDFELASHMFEIYSKKLKEYKKSSDKPYFARIDYKKQGDNEIEKFYIGKTSLLNKEDKRMLIVDWRAPISGVYYSGELGEAMYRSPDGLVIGELLLKRQFEIEKRRLINIFDKGLTPMDEFLQKALWEKKDNRLKDIIMTIQSEQNDIIRAERNRVVIVQGAAGSGKTTIVLHRIAYLMYTFKESLKPNKILTLVPNRLFLNYISDVLPDLGIEDIVQSTFEELSYRLIGKNIKILNKEEKIIELLDKAAEKHDYRENLMKISAFKGSMILKKIIDDYIYDLEKNIIPKDRGIIIEGYELYPAEELNKMFDKNYYYLPLIKRVNRLKGFIKGTLKERINEIKFDLLERLDKKHKSIDEFEEKKSEIERIENNSKKVINDYFKSLKKINIENIYKEIITNKNILSKYINNDNEIEFINDYSQNIFKKKLYESDDLVPLTYLKLKLSGLADNLKFNHIVVDEAQDYNSLQMIILKELSENNSFTIVGDLSQGIYSHSGIYNWNDFIQNVFGDKNTDFLKIRKCYRATKEIMEFANKVIKKSNNQNIILAEPVLRSGDVPAIIESKNQIQMISDIADNILKLIDDGLKSVAVVCRTSEESNEVYKKLKKEINYEIQHISSNDTEYKGGIVVTPIYMAKGLEFDGVIVYNCSEESFSKNELDIKLLYVAITRALHKLIIFYTGEQSLLLE